MLAAAEATLEEQVRQAKIVIPAMVSAVKDYVQDYLFGGKFGDPPPQLLEACKHIKPNNDAQERCFGIVDFRVHKHPNESTEMTDARLKNKINKPEEELAKQSPAARQKSWKGARAEFNRRKPIEKQRREEYAQARMRAVEEKEQKNERKTSKKKKKEAEFKAVQVVRTQEQLDKLLHGTGERVGKQIVKKQIDQLTSVYGVSRRTLPQKRLGFETLYANLSALLSFGDPTLPSTEAAFKAATRAKQRGKKRGRPAGSQKPAKRQRQDDEWMSDE